MKKHNILIVDDEEMVLKTIYRILLTDNYKIFTATSGEEGLSKLKKCDVSMIISDQRMPGMSGLEFLEKVKINYPETLTILMTAHADIDIAMKAINEAGVYKFILKPLDVNTFKITIRRALESLQVIKERNSLKQQVKEYDAILRDLESEHPGISNVAKDEFGNYLAL